MEYGTFSVDAEARRVKGILLPWGEKSRTSASKTKPITFPRGSVTIPRDPAVVGLNRAHDRFDWVGRADVLEDQDQGVYAEFVIADTDEGDEWLKDHGKFVKLSAEVKDIVRDAKNYGTAKLTGAALVSEGAFASAALFAVDGDPDEDDDPDEEPDEDTEPPEGDEEDEQDDEPDETEGDAVADATAKEVMLAGRGKREEPLTAQGFFSAMHRARNSGDRSGLLPYLRSDVAVDEKGDASGMFALTSVKYDAGGLAETALIPGGWLGQLWQGKTFQRNIVPQLTQGTLTGIKASGFVWGVKPTMAAWNGNKTAVPSNTPTTVPKDFFAQRFAGGHDLSREYYDFNVTEIIESYVQYMIDSYAVLSDGYALTQLEAGATAFTPATTTTNKGQSAIIDGMLAVQAANATPSYAVVAPNVWRDVFATTATTAPAYSNPTVDLSGGTVLGVPVIADSRLAAGHIIVGAKEAATSWELPGVPIRVSSVHADLGGIDETFFGYIAVGVTYPAAVVKATLTLP